jgi:hypothetical protein
MLLHNEELHNLHGSPNMIMAIKPRRMRWMGHVARMGEMRSAFKILVGKREGKRPRVRPGRRWEDNNIRMETVWESVDLMPLGTSGRLL